MYIKMSLYSMIITITTFEVVYAVYIATFSHTRQKIVSDYFNY